MRLCGSQDVFRKEAAILKRLVRQFGPAEVERMIVGAQLLGWTSLRSLGSKDGLGRRWALTKFWDGEKKSPKRLESLGQTFKRLGLT